MNIGTVPTGSDEEFDPVEQNTDAVVKLHASSERSAGPHQRAIEGLTDRLGKPWLLYVAVLFVGIWVAANTYGHRMGFLVWDRPPFAILQGISSLTALFVSILVLITQNRQGRVNQRRSQLDLHIGLLVDKRCAKIIDMLEEIRNESPYLQSRQDATVDVLKTAVDAQAVASVLETRIEEMIVDREEDESAMTGDLERAE